MPTTGGSEECHLKREKVGLEQSHGGAETESRHGAEVLLARADVNVTTLAKGVCL